MNNLTDDERSLVVMTMSQVIRVMREDAAKSNKTPRAKGSMLSAANRLEAIVKKIEGE